MEKQTTCKSCKNLIAAALMMLCFASGAFAQNLQTTLGETWNGIAWENAFLSTNTHDGNNYLVGTVSQVWSLTTGQWVNVIKLTYTNNATGGATQVLIESWDPDTSEWIISQRITNTLNGSNQVLTSITEMWLGAEWFNVSKQTNTYAGGFLTVTLSETWDFLTSAWINNTLTNYTNNADGTVNQAVVQTWNTAGSVWVNWSRSTYTYNGSDQMLTELTEMWDGAAWQNESRTTNSYSGGFLSVSLSEIWLPGSSSWENDTQSFFTNNADGTIAQIVIQEWSFGDPAVVQGSAFWVNSARITYTYDGLGIADLARNRVVVYPNPANDFITIKSDADDLNAYSIVDQQGRTVQQGSLSDFETSVDVSGLSSGIYFFQVGEGKKAAIKLIKQ